MNQILRFNWPWYACAAVGLAVSILVIAWVNCGWQVKAACAMATVPAVFWFISSMAASYWVYDRSDVKACRWLARFSGLNPGKVANVHAGFDETTGHLRAFFPKAQFQIWDIFDASTMTEGSIVRARELKGCGPEAMRVNPSQLPAADGTFDTIFAIFAAHEQRSAVGRLELFREFARILTPQGRLIVVEHLRDWRNFIAYGPGFLHFFSATEWRRVARAADLHLSNDFSVTPFVKIFCFKRNL